MFDVETETCSCVLLLISVVERDGILVSKLVIVVVVGNRS